jgi:hypothetical protein
MARPGLVGCGAACYGRLRSGSAWFVQGDAGFDVTINPASINQSTDYLSQGKARKAWQMRKQKARQTALKPIRPFQTAQRI